MLRSQVTPKSSVREDRVDASLQEAEVMTVGAERCKLDAVCELEAVCVKRTSRCVRIKCCVQISRCVRLLIFFARYRNDETPLRGLLLFLVNFELFF